MIRSKNDPKTAFVSFISIYYILYDLYYILQVGVYRFILLQAGRLDQLGERSSGDLEVPGSMPGVSRSS